MRVGIAELLQSVKNFSRQDQIDFLRGHNHTAIQKLLQLAFDVRVKWLLPEGKPPYKPCQFTDQESMFYNEVRRLYLFLEGGNPNLTQKRREQLFSQLLESLMPDDAKFLIAVKDKKLEEEYGIMFDVVNEAFPGLVECGPATKIKLDSQVIENPIETLKKVEQKSHSVDVGDIPIETAKKLVTEIMAPKKRVGNFGHKHTAETRAKMVAYHEAKRQKKKLENEQKLSSTK